MSLLAFVATQPIIDIAVFDSSPSTRALLLERLAQFSGCSLRSFEQLASARAGGHEGRYGVVIVNHHAGDADPFAVLAEMRRQAPAMFLVVIASPGEPLRTVEAFQARHGCIDHIFSKPIDLEALARVVGSRLEAMRQQQTLQDDHQHLLRFLPTAALQRIFSKPKPGSAEMFEMTVMFTDIRDSSRLIMRESPSAYFAQLNALLAGQAQQVRKFEGMVVKTTGDGLLAVFEGPARCHLALKCASAIQEAAMLAQGMASGIGLSDGLVLAGILGSVEQLHFDVIGAQVHLASRLCSHTLPGEILVTADVAERAHFTPAGKLERETILMRGFDLSVPCVRFQPDTVESS